ncbi:DUF6514 family protein [Anaerosporobacter faecicola]|uniref:DUF6514 family protein n=1 Tax=Anaerosporobacter faecicola TaxID=2718714 RepID=UPI00143878FB|nr:DUF6514 family protein [Anaerosporobacter faecicola]
MRVVHLIGEKKVELEDQREMVLLYYLIEEPSKEMSGKDGSSFLYGIKIEKQFGGIVESEEVEALSYSKEVVMQLINTLMECTVTPLTLIEVVDDLITLKLCS